MKVRRLSLASLVTALVVAVISVFFAGCSAFGGDQNTFAPGGDVADRQRDLFMLVLWPALIIFILVAGILLYAVVRYRRRREDEPAPKQVHGNLRLEIAWTLLPTLLLIGLAVPTVDTIFDLGRSPKDDALHVKVVAFQWDWRFEYLNPEFVGADGEPLTSDELHVPVGREVGVTLEALDVIHSFWVPKLAGKLDAIPGRNNQMWFKATEPGTYSGQCAEFCGLGHAGMRFDVIAQTEEEFQAWAEEELASQSGDASQGSAAGG